MKKQQNGFTLIELLIVVAIIGILAAVSLPLYRDYVIRTKAGNAIASITAIKAAVALNYSMTGQAEITGATEDAIVVDRDGDTSGWESLGMMTPNAAGLPKEVQSITVDRERGNIAIVITDEVETTAAGGTITFFPRHSVGHTSWAARYDSADEATDLATPVIQNLLLKTVGPAPEADDAEEEEEEE